MTTKQAVEKSLTERLRACGPFMASDGHMAVSVGSYKDAHEAADVIEAADELADAVVHRPIEGELMAAALRRYFKVRGSEKEEFSE